MSTTVETATEIRPFQVEIPEEQIDDLRRRIAGDALAEQGARRRSLAGRAAGDHEGARPLLGERLRLAQGRGEAERAPAVHDRDRRGRHPLHPRPVAARGRAAADHDPRLARLGDRAARDHRPADRSDGARRQAGGRVPPRAAVPPRLRLLRRADRDRLVLRPRRAGLGGADAPPRLHPLRRPGRRPGRRRHGRHGAPGARRADRRPPEPAQDRARRHAPACRRSPSRNARPSTLSRRSRRAASATSSSSPRGRRRSATRCWTPRSPWPRG